MRDIPQIFEQELESVIDGYVLRQEQVALAENIRAVIEAGKTGIFEAGTGTGKTLSYLIPAFLSQDPVIVSTGTKNLQDQLYTKDVPALRALFPRKRIALLKGRTNYLCPYRLKANLEMMPVGSNQASRLVEVRTWWSRTSTGDLTELFDLEENDRLMNLITSTRDNCLGSRCPEFSECPLYRARAVASRADLVIVNHHLLFADLAQQEDSLQSLFPDASAIIVDEAHQIPNIARQFFGQRLSGGQFTELIRDGRAELELLGNDDPETTRELDELEKSSIALRAEILNSDEQDFNLWYVKKPQAVVHDLGQKLMEAGDRLDQIADRSEGLAQCARRAVMLIERFALLTGNTASEDEYVHWIERRERGYSIHLSPLSVAESMSDIISASKRAWIFTSATLSMDGQFRHFADELGLDDSISAVFSSPFDFAASVRAYLPAGLPTPGSDRHTVALVQEVMPVINANQGRTFFLFTSHRALRVADELMKDAGMPVFSQGSMSKSRLLSRFRESERSILLATQSFWEGIDVRGSDLRCLIIDKMPFPSPGEPLFSARSRVIDEMGGNSFIELSLPRAVLSLKQGFGRLIREETDKGLFIIGDGRLRHRAYSRHVIGNLPDIPWLDSRDDAISWLQAL